MTRDANLKVRVKSAKGRKLSSTRWLERQLNDPYVREANRLGYRSRAAFKILEIDDKFKNIIKCKKETVKPISYSIFNESFPSN